MSGWRLGSNLALTMVIVAAGCDDAGTSAAEETGIVRQDSAGIEIVEIPGAVLASLPVWKISDEPRASIGATEGEDPYLFSGIRGDFYVASLPGGEVAIVDSQSREIRVFGPDGRFVRKMGRSGEGPGEFSGRPVIQHDGVGGIVALETSSHRITRFDAQGHLIETWVTTLRTECPDQPCVASSGVMGNGGVPLTYVDRPTVSTAELGQSFENLSAKFGLATRDGYNRLMDLPAPPMRIYRGTPRRDGSENIVARTPELLMSPPYAVSGEGHIAILTDDRYEVRIFSGSGTLERIIRVNRPRTPLSAAEADAIEAQESEVPRDAGNFRPEFSFARFGESDDLWVYDYNPPGSTEPDRITIFSVDGAPVARLEVPYGDLHEGQTRASSHQAISSREVFRVVTEDALGVDRLLMFSIVKATEP